jgi:CBS domain-containing protein
MKVQDAMTGSVGSCRPTANLAEVTRIMWHHDCGIVPVVNDRDEVVGVVTDRDVAIALGTRGRRAGEVSAADVMSTAVVTCAPEDRVAAALALMQQHRVRRLPVVGIGGVLLGMLSVIVVIVHTPQKPTADPLMAALRAISAHQQPLVTSA